ncbi:Putative Pc12g15110 protein [[Torrubiella] hemipterigena]|uniref:Putative Pc12g15110 protein n=1 Tax=[Torrubiella] hemipterigena TaxID=1531966 RepID=A0A0A1TBT3_9HYPO|nr:Putative Pc12g15110 protein [[Torrubiella] hemipterigena]
MDETALSGTSHSLAPLQHQKPRPRRGSLRKVALLGKDSQRPRRDNSPLSVSVNALAHTNTTSEGDINTSACHQHTENNALGLNIQGRAPKSKIEDQFTSASSAMASSERIPDAAVQDTSTTDDDDILQISQAPPPRPSAITSSVSDSYYSAGTSHQRRSFHQAKSPLSYGGISTTALPPPDTDWDYAETEWWGWVVLSVTWFVFVIGMGSCLDIWSWAWDVGKTPYAPPELEDDPTLPIVGYYPALIILTCVMAWVWVVVAWVGMKYFRHAKISGD